MWWLLAGCVRLPDPVVPDDLVPVCAPAPPPDGPVEIVGPWSGTGFSFARHSGDAIALSSATASWAVAADGRFARLEPELSALASDCTAQGYPDHAVVGDLWVDVDGPVVDVSDATGARIAIAQDGSARVEDVDRSGTAVRASWGAGSTDGWYEDSTEDIRLSADGRHALVDLRSRSIMEGSQRWIRIDLDGGEERVALTGGESGGTSYFFHVGHLSRAGTRVTWSSDSTYLPEPGGVGTTDLDPDDVTDVLLRGASEEGRFTRWFTTATASADGRFVAALVHDETGAITGEPLVPFAAVVVDRDTGAIARGSDSGAWQDVHLTADGRTLAVHDGAHLWVAPNPLGP